MLQPLSKNIFHTHLLKYQKHACLKNYLINHRLKIYLGSCFIIRGGWFKDVLTYKNWSFDFLYGLYVPSNKFNVKFVFISLLKPGFSNICIMSFHILFRSISQNCLSIFLCNSVDCFSSLFDIEYRLCMPKNSLIPASWKLPMVTSKQLSVFSFFEGSISMHNKDLLQCFITFYIFLKYQCIVG